MCSILRDLNTCMLLFVVSHFSMVLGPVDACMRPQDPYMQYRTIYVLESGLKLAVGWVAVTRT